MALKKERKLDFISEFGKREIGIVARLIWTLATHKNIARSYRKIIRKKLASRFPGPFDIQIEGVQIRAYPLENYCDRTAVGRGHLPEIPERALIKPLLKPGMIFVDVGANIGTYSLFVAKNCGDKARILSFEPHPRTYAKLSFNSKTNGFSSIEAINLGVGPEKSRMRLYSNGGTNIGTATIVPDPSSAKVFVDIKIVPLADALKSRLINHVDLLKIDIEGFEDRALLPLMTPENKSLWPKAVLIETVLKEHWQEDCVEHLKSLGYTIGGNTGENVLLLHPMTEKLES